MANLKRGNRVVTVDSDRVDGYLKRGYDQIDKNGRIVKHATGGKDISVSEFNKLKEKYEELKSNDDKEKIEMLVNEQKKLEEKAKEFAEKGKELQKENESLKKQLKEAKGK